MKSEVSNRLPAFQLVNYAVNSSTMLSTRQLNIIYMKKVDFKNFPIRMNIGSDEVKKVDTRESIGNAVYHNAAGVRGLDLAMKIYKSEGVIELDDGEWSLLMQIANQTLVAPVVETLINIGKEE